MSGQISFIAESVCVFQPVGGTFFEPTYAQAIRDQFAAAVAHLPEDKRPTMIVFADPNGQAAVGGDVPPDPADREKAGAAPKSFRRIQEGAWVKFGNGDVHAYYDLPSRSVVIGHNREHLPEYPLAIQMFDNGTVSLQLPAGHGQFPDHVNVDPEVFGARLVAFMESFIPKAVLPEAAD